MESELEGLLPVFEAEARECLDSLEQALITLEREPGDEEALRSSFRMAHTLKGGAATLGFRGISEFSHRLEDWLQGIRAGRLAISREAISLLLASVDELRAMAGEAFAGGDPGRRAGASILRRVEEAISGASPSAPTETEEREPGPAPDPAARSASDGNTLRVAVDRLDEILNRVGELSIARGRLQGAMELLGPAAPVRLVEAHREAERLSLELQEEVLRLRMVPLGPTFRQQFRTVRDVAASRGKIVRLVIEGDDLEVDTSVIEHLRHPLTHLIRNAVDHGIELPEERERAGKEACGRIHLRARRQPGTIEVEVSDDGAGLDRAAIRRRARSQFPGMDLERLPDAEIDRLIFESGFSTAPQVTEVSGRGVGLDVVRRDIEAMRSQVHVESAPSRGTTFRFRLPLTLAMIDGFSVAAGEETYVLPLEAVVECLALPADAGLRAGEEGVLSLRGSALPCLPLRRFFRIPGDPPRRQHVVVVRRAGGCVGLVVDALLGSGKTVIKRLGPQFRNVAGVAGSAILGTGRVAFILDLEALIAEALRGGAAAMN